MIRYSRIKKWTKWELKKSYRNEFIVKTWPCSQMSVVQMSLIDDVDHSIFYEYKHKITIEKWVLNEFTCRSMYNIDEYFYIETLDNIEQYVVIVLWMNIYNDRSSIPKLMQQIDQLLTAKWYLYYHRKYCQNYFRYWSMFH